jgi:hypothetical protein
MTTTQLPLRLPAEPSDEPTSSILRTKNVFVDTSIHVTAKFVYASGNFRRLADLAAGDLVTLYDTEVDRGEIRSNIREAAEEAANGLRRFQREAVGLQAVPAGEVAALFHPLTANRIETLLMQEYTGYRLRARVRDVPLSEVDSSEVFKRYFDRQPPFEEKKRSEFPDAFIIAALSGWCWDRSELMYVVSGDKGFRSAAAATGRGRLIPLENLDQLLNLVVSEQNQEFAISAQGWLRAHETVIMRQVKEAFLDSGFYVDDADGDAEDIEIDDLRATKPLLIEADGSEAVFSFVAEITFTAVLSYDEPGTEVYDREDDITIYAERRRVRVRRTAEVDVEVRVLFHTVTLPTPSEGEAEEVEGEVEEVRLNGGRDFPVSIDDELVQVFFLDDDRFDWFSGEESALDDEPDPHVPGAAESPEF